jgi:chaperonin cofactor prefoldin
MEAMASIREMKRSGRKGDDEIFMNFGDIFVAATREKVEEQLKVGLHVTESLHSTS